MNIQPIEKLAKTDGSTLVVHSIFKTIQGEGPFVGTPCVFIRLAGCNLQCPGCDTDYTSSRREMGIYEILASVNEIWRAERWRRGLIVVTGGEPFRQNLTPLFHVLGAAGYYVQVESNGTLQPSPFAYSQRPDERDGVYLVVSPKTRTVHPDAWRYACAIKYVVREDDVAEDGLPLHALDHPQGPPARLPANYPARVVYVQPMDVKDDLQNWKNMNEAVASCLAHGYTLGLQVHKLVGVE